MGFIVLILIVWCIGGLIMWLNVIEHKKSNNYDPVKLNMFYMCCGPIIWFGWTLKIFIEKCQQFIEFVAASLVKDEYEKKEDVHNG